MCDFRDQRQGLLLTVTYVDDCILPEVETQSWFRSTCRYRDCHWYGFLMTLPGFWTDSLNVPARRRFLGKRFPCLSFEGILLLCFESCR